MYCKNCGQKIKDKATYCPYCGTVVSDAGVTSIQDAPNINFAIIGFFLGLFVPVVGLLLFLVYYDKYPQRAKSVGKGTLIGFLIYIVYVIIILILVPPALIRFIDNNGNTPSDTTTSTSSISNNPTMSTNNPSTDGILTNYAQVTFGEFTERGAYSTSLEVTVKNISSNAHSFNVRVGAIAEDGISVIKTDSFLTKELRPGESVGSLVFLALSADDIVALKHASFKVLEITYFG